MTSLPYINNFHEILHTRTKTHESLIYDNDNDSAIHFYEELHTLFITINCNLLSFSRKNSRHVINSAEKGGLLNSVILVSGWKWSKDQAWRYLRFMRISVYVYVLILSAITPVFFCTTWLDTRLWISKPRFLYSDVLFMDFYYYTNPIQWSHAVLHTVI